MIAAVPKTGTVSRDTNMTELIGLVHEVLKGSLQRLHPTLSKEGITMGQFWAIKTVSSLESGSLNSIARYLGLSSPTVCANIDQLEAAGLVRRQRSEKDRRTVEISLTPRGRKVESRVWSAVSRVMRDAGREVAPDDLAAAVRVFREVSQKLTDHPIAYREGP